MAASAAIASAFRASCHAGQQCECSQAWPLLSVPNGSSGLRPRSGPPQPRQRSVTSATGIDDQPARYAGVERPGLGLRAQQVAVVFGDGSPFGEVHLPVCGIPSLPLD